MDRFVTLLLASFALLISRAALVGRNALHGSFASADSETIPHLGKIASFRGPETAYDSVFQSKSSPESWCSPQDFYAW